MKGIIINSNEMRLRLIQLEYNNDLSKHNLSKEEFEKAVKDFKEEFTSDFKRIYLEENRQPLNVDMDIVTSQELNIGNESGYNGTAIHFHSRENNIDEIYVISQGSQGAEDWGYNIKAMLAGKDIGDWCLSLPVFCLIMLNDNRFSNQLDDSRNKMDEIDRICLCGRQEHD